MSALPPEFWVLLEFLARASARYEATSGRRAVIVGGAAVSFYTQGQILSGDFDLVADIDFEQNLLAEGFQKETGQGRFLGGYFHPKAPQLSVELVSGSLFDGRSDVNKILAVRVVDDADVLFPPIEDMIADRLGQFAASKNIDMSMLGQARLLLKLALDFDQAYLKRRIVEESGDPAALGIV
jgi:hypothetical protein